MSNVFHIVPELPFDEKAREKAVEMLEAVLAELRAGNIDEVVVFGFSANGAVAQWQSPSLSVTRVVGALEIAKHTRIHNLWGETQ